MDRPSARRITPEAVERVNGTVRTPAPRTPPPRTPAPATVAG